jgi:hypothetical protein
MGIAQVLPPVVASPGAGDDPGARLDVADHEGRQPGGGSVGHDRHPAPAVVAGPAGAQKCQFGIPSRQSCDGRVADHNNQAALRAQRASSRVRRNTERDVRSSVTRMRNAESVQLTGRLSAPLGSAQVNPVMAFSASPRLNAFRYWSRACGAAASVPFDRQQSAASDRRPPQRTAAKTWRTDRSRKAVISTQWSPADPGAFQVDPAPPSMRRRTSYPAG